MALTTTSWLQAIGKLFRSDREQTGWAWDERRYAHALWDAYYSNTIYDTIQNGGQREWINASLGNASAADLAGLFNPVASVVDLYINVFGGAFGDEIKIEPQGEAKQELVKAVEQVWRWSNMTIEKQPLCRLAATHGTVGLRIVARNHEDETRRRVYIKPEHPRVIRDARLDERGNVEEIQLEYDMTIGLAEDTEIITIREVLAKDVIRTYKLEGGIEPVPFDLMTMEENGPNAEYENALGVVPYVLLRHEHTGSLWGRNAFYRARAPIDRLNALMSHIDVQVHRHVRAKWAVFASGSAPQEFDLSDLSIAYFDTRNSPSQPVIAPMVAPLNLADAIEQSRLQMEIIQDMLPELKAVEGKFLANQSGETIAELRKPAEERVMLARTNYEDALVRAQQIAVSWGILLELWDVGTGMGSKEMADEAYHGGFEDHKFNTRAALPLGDTPVLPQQDAAERPQVTRRTGAETGQGQDANDRSRTERTRAPDR